jgi:hypothetical protein
MIYPNPARVQRLGPRQPVATALASAAATDQCVPEEGLAYEPASFRYAAICGSAFEICVHP